MKSRLKSIFGLIYKPLYYLLIFFIVIGDFIQWFFLTFFIFLLRIFNYFFLSFYRVVYFFKKIILLLFSLFINLIKRVKLPKIFIKKNFSDFFSLKVKYFILGALTVFIFFIFYQSYLFVKSLPSPTTIGIVNYPLSTHLYDRNGQLLYEVYREQNRTPISLNELPKHVVYSTIAIEDKDFYKHNGIALFSVFRAIKETIFKKNLQGGSTITQQLVKTALLTPERTIKRKIKEVILALWTEKLYSKDKILEMYLNQVPYGGSSYGIEEAAKTYFGKKAKDLTLEEAALLAGLPQAPSVYSPYINPEAALRRRNEVLETMEKQGYINKKIKEQAQKSKLEVLPPKTSIIAPHFVFYVKSKLESYFGIQKVEEGGLKVITTLDINIQKEAEKILEEELAKISYLNVSNGAILITRPSTGEILAMVGSVDYFFQPWGAYNVTTALRQPGSSIKPILYSLALQNNFTAASIIDDSPSFFKIEGSSPYQPVNYDGKFHGRIPLRYALANSYNIPAVKVLNSLGVENFINFARKLGIKTWKEPRNYGLSLALGGGEVTMVDMAEAFGVLANLGYRLPLNYYLKIEDNKGEVIKEIRPFKIKEIDSGVAFIINDILSDNYARTWAFGTNSALEIPGYKVAVKTGTTDNKKDNWTIGYTPDFLVAVWVGNNDGSPMNPYLTSGITGAAPIWNRVMSYLLKNYSSNNKWYKKPDNVVEKICYFGRKEYFLVGTEKTAFCRDQLFNQTPTPSPR